MRIEQANQELKRPLAFLAEGYLSWLISRGKINNFTADSAVVLNYYPAKWAFSILSGCCQLRRFLPEETGAEILRAFKRGETSSRLLPSGATVVAVEDSAMFCIRLREMAEAIGQYIRAGREIVLRQLDEIKVLVQEKGTSYEFKSASEAVAAVV